MDVAEMFNQLESNQPAVVEEIKKTFHENLNSTKESWLVSGLLEYYLSTNSIRCVEILVGVREPHDKHLFDKLSEILKGPSKLQGLTLLGQIVKRQPTWLYKITQYPIFKDLLKLLKIETDIVSLMSALLVVVVLIPMIPALVGPYLQDVFEVFSRLAAWNTNNPNKLPEQHLLHLQVVLYALFHRLYGMYPCNFLSYLRHEYGQREFLGIFSHTIKPMLDTVRVHPLLVTASKDAETAPSRWKSMEHHDVIIECAKMSVDVTEQYREDSNHYHGQGLPTLVRASLDLSLQHQFRTLSRTNDHEFSEKEVWSPSSFCGLLKTPPPPSQESIPTSIPQTPNSQVHTTLPFNEGTSPPEAAIEATPETTPIKDSRRPPTSKVVRALNSFGDVTPTLSQPSSPMRKEPSPSPFHFPSERQPRRDSLFSRSKIQQMHQDRMHLTGDQYQDEKQPPSPLSLEGTPLDLPSEEQEAEDQEVVEIVRQGEQLKMDKKRQCDSVLQEFHPPHVDELEECIQEQGSTCHTGGLHLPNSRSMLDLNNRLQRFYGQYPTDLSSEICSIQAQSTEKTSTGTQTVDDWAPVPYEHMFLGVVPCALSPEPKYSPDTMLSRYVDLAVNTKESKGEDNEIRILKEQLLLFNIQLQFERHRREVHAERNRRLLGKSRATRALEEHNSALSDQISLLQRDIESLHRELEKTKEANKLNEEQLQETVIYWQNQFNGAHCEIKDLMLQMQVQEQELIKVKETTTALNKEFRQVESMLFDTNKDRTHAFVGEQLRTNLEQANKEIILMGELQQRYRERFSQLAMLRNMEQELEHVHEAYHHEIRLCHEALETRISELTAANMRVAELEGALSRKDILIADHKRMLEQVKEEYTAQWEAVESKYNTQRAINQKFEEYIVELNQKIEKAAGSGKGHRSPDTDSVSSGEKQLGPNSPLSQSLCSAEGVSLSGILGGQAMEMTDLQQIVDKPVNTLDKPPTPAELSEPLPISSNI